MPINEPNLDNNYILDFGDELKIQLTGQKDFIERFVINRDGSINIDEVGKINLMGLGLEEAINLIRTKVQNKYVGTDAFVTLVNVRDVNVLVSGNAFNPGVYTLNGNSNILHAISVAGGIDEFGSYREINLIRNNEIIETLDIYDLLISGDYKLKKRLQSGDVNFVTAIKNLISIDGALKRPAKYELKNDESLFKVIDFAIGLNKFADLDNIYLERVLDGKLQSLPIVNISNSRQLMQKMAIKYT